MSDKWVHWQPDWKSSPDSEIANSVREMSARKTAYREIDGGIFGDQNARSSPCLSHKEMGKIIESAGIPLRGWEDVWSAEEITEWIEKEGLPWIEGSWSNYVRSPESGDLIPRHSGHPISALEIYNSLAGAITFYNRLHDGVTGFADDTTQKYLRELEKSARYLYNNLNDERLLIAFTNNNIHPDIERLRDALKIWPDRFLFLARLSRNAQKYTMSVPYIVGHLASCFHNFFGVKATKRWKQKKPEAGKADDSALNIPDGPFVHFAMSFFEAAGHPVALLTIQTALSDHRKMLRSPRRDGGKRKG